MTMENQSFGQHLAELRKRLTWSAVVVGMVTAVAFVFHQQILTVLMVPADGFTQTSNYKPVYTELTEFIDECENKGVTFVACEWGGADFETLAKDERVTLLTCLRHPIKRLISNYNYDHYWMWTKARSYEEYLKEGHLHSSSEYYTKIFARGENDLQKAKSNLTHFDYVIIAEDGMSALDELGWSKESDTTHPTFGDSKRALILLAKFRWIRLFNYLRKIKYRPPSELKIEDKNQNDLLLYESLRV